MDGPTITLIIGIVTCVIGVSTFVGSLQNKAQNNGVLQQKLEQAIQGIEEIKKQVEKSNAVQSEINIQITSHSEQIRTIYKTIDELKERVNTVENMDSTLNKILDAIRSLKEDQHEK